MRKKFTRLALVLGLTGILSINTFAATFTDVADNHWAYPGISYMQQNGYMTMNSKGQFFPNEQVSYFDFAEILAKMTGYQDKNVVKDMDPQLKADIDKMYVQQLPYIQQYDNANKYKLWKKSANEELAYVLARGYLNHNDLAKFMIKSADGKELYNIVTKQDLARYLVFYLGKAETANTEYAQSKTTGFKDEHLMREENKPYVAYLKKLGVVNGDANGNFGANDKVTRALCAAMTTTIDRMKETQPVVPPTTTNPTPPTTTTPEQGTQDLAGKVYNIVPRNNAQNETLVLVEIDGKNKFYTATATTQVVDAKGNTINVSDIKIGHQISFTVNPNDTIQKIQLQTVITDTETEDKKETALYTGEVDRIGRGGDMTIYTSKGTVTFDISKDCEMTYEDEAITLEEIGIGDSVRIKTVNNIITEIEVTEKAKVEEKVVEFVKSIQKVDHFVFTVTDGKTHQDKVVDEDATIYRDEKEVDVEELRIGDKLTFTVEKDKVVKVEAESTQNKIQGTIKSILIAKMPEVVITTKEGDVAVAITSNSELYDSNIREDVTIRDLALGMKVEVRMDSKEATSFVIDKAPAKVRYQGTIQEVGSAARYIDILVEYDKVTQETMVVKRVNVPQNVTIIVDGKTGHRKQLEEDMEVLVTYNYGEDLYPIEIEVLD